MNTCLHSDTWDKRSGFTFKWSLPEDLVHPTKKKHAKKVSATDRSRLLELKAAILKTLEEIETELGLRLQTE